MDRLMLGALALVPCLVFGAGRSVTPDMYGGNAKAWQVQRHNEKMKLVAQGGAKVVFIGDSITHFWEGSGKGVWQKYFADGEFKALNLGTSADRTEHLLWRLAAGELDGYEAKCILLMIGTNNTGHFPIEKESPADTVAGIRKVLDLIAAKQPKARIVLTSIFPRGNGPTDGYRVRNNAVNKEIAKFADGKKIIWCDFSDKYLDREGRLSHELFPDYLHPNALGYEIWANEVMPLIRQCLTASPDAVIPSVWPSAPAYYAPVKPPAPAKK